MKTPVFASLFFLSFFLSATTGKISAQIISTVAGNGSSGHTGDGGAATAADIGTPWGIAVDSKDNIYVSDSKGIRKIDRSGIISTVAGYGTTGYTGDGGPAIAARFNGVSDIAVDKFDNLYVCDMWNNCVRKIDGLGIINTVAGNGVAAGTGYGSYSGDGLAATLAGLYHPSGVAVDDSGNVIISDQDNYRIRKVNTSGIINTIVGTGVWSYSGDGGPATGAEISRPCGVKIDKKGNLFFADWLNSCIRKVDTFGIITTFAGSPGGSYSGDGGLATLAKLNQPTGLAIDKSGVMYISDEYNYVIRKVSAAGIMSTVAGDTKARYNGDSGLADTSSLNQPIGLALDSKQDLYIADNANVRVRKITYSVPTGVYDHKIKTASYSLFPNPALSQITITGTDDIKTVIVLNALGKAVHTENFRKNAVQINISDLPGGVYFVRVNNVSIGEFVKK